MRKQKQFKYRVTKYKGQLEALGEQGWRLVTTDGNEGIFMQEDVPSYEYMTVPVDTHPRHIEMMQETLDAMTADGWRLVSTMQGRRVVDVVLLFEREAGG